LNVSNNQSRKIYIYIYIYIYLFIYICYKVMVIHWFNRGTYMIDTNMITLYVNICINYLICILYEIHVVYINKTFLISSNTHKKVVSHSLFFLFFFPLLLTLFYNMLSTSCPNQLRASESFFYSKDNVLHVLIQALPNPFFIYNFILYFYFGHKNVWLYQSSFLSDYYYYFIIMMIIITIILCVNSKHVKP